MSNAEAWPLLVGVFTPLLVSFVVQAQWSSQTKRLVQIGTSVVVGLITAFIQGDLSHIDTSNILSTLMLLYGACQAAYTLIWKPSGIAEKVEVATTLDYEGRHAA